VSAESEFRVAFMLDEVDDNEVVDDVVGMGLVDVIEGGWRKVCRSFVLGVD